MNKFFSQEHIMPQSTAPVFKAPAAQPVASPAPNDSKAKYSAELMKMLAQLVMLR